MTYEEKNTWVSLAVSIVVLGYIILRLLGLQGEGAFDGDDALVVWAQTVLWAIPLSIAGVIIGSIIFSIGYAIATQESNPSFVVDERDKGIGKRALSTAIFVASAGFILALVALAFGWQPLIALNVIFFGFAAGDFIGNLVKLWSYRQGY